MNELALFAGAGGGILGGKLLGWTTVCAVERDAYAAQILIQRQNDRILDPFPVWSDVTSFDGKPWRGLVDVVSGGFPCQNISNAGDGTGIEGKKSRLWHEAARVIGEIRPRYAFLENSPMLTSRGLGTVLADLSQMGYNAEWGIIGAHVCGAPHVRKRIWILAYRKEDAPRSDADSIRPHHSQIDQHGWRERWGAEFWNQQIRFLRPVAWWDTEPRLERVADRVANTVDRIRAVGNGQVPIVAAFAWNILYERINK